MVVGDAYVCPGFLTPVLTQLFFPKPPTTFLTCLCTGERGKYAGKKSHLNRGSNSQPPGLESDTLTTEPPRRVEKQNPTISIMVLGYKEKIVYPLRNSVNTDRDHNIILMLIEKDGVKHYCLVKNISRLLSSQAKKVKEKNIFV